MFVPRVDGGLCLLRTCRIQIYSLCLGKYQTTALPYNVSNKEASFKMSCARLMGLERSNSEKIFEVSEGLVAGINF